MTGLDTNVLVRYICQDDAAQAAVAGRIIERVCSAESPGFVHDIVLVELVWVLRDSFGFTRALIADVVERLLAARQLKIADPDRAWAALKLFRQTPAGFSDCLLAVRNIAAGCEHTLTFDRDASKLPGAALAA